MALISSRLAIMSVGMSCQVAQQLKVHAQMLRDLTGAPLELHTTPWDWVICPPAGVAAMVRDGVTMPRNVGDLEQRHRPYWPARSCWFWHEKGAISHHADTLSRALEHEAWLDQVASARRRIFILANTQNNLEAQRREHGGFTIAFERKAVADLEAALVSRFGPSEVHVVTHPGKHRLFGRPLTWELKPDRSSWEGHAGQWAHLLGKMVRPTN